MNKRSMKTMAAVMIVAVLIQLVNVTTVSGAVSLTDIGNHWGKSHIETLVSKGAINGYLDNTFKPDNTITRAEFVTVLAKALDLEPVECVEFMDIMTHWANGYVGAALNYGLLDGDDYRLGDLWAFEPNRNITRGEIARILVRALGNEYSALTYSGSLDKFSDGSAILSDFKGYISQANEMGIINGYPDGTFGSEKTATRAEASVMLVRMIDKMEAKPELELADSEVLYQKSTGNVVKINNYDLEGELIGTGSGFLINMDGHIVTNYHVIEGGIKLTVEFTDGTVINVKNIYNYDIYKDIAVLNIGTVTMDIEPVVIGNDKDVNTGSKIYTVGYPLGEGLSITDGLISSKYAEVYGTQYIQISAPISPGNSGGPLYDKFGRVIGVNTLTLSSIAENMNYSVPISFIGEILTEDRTMSLSEFAAQSNSIKEAYDAKIVSQKVYGIDKKTGDKIYREDGYFSIDEISTFGVEIVLLHEEVGGHNGMNIMMAVYDGDYDTHDYNFTHIGLSDTNLTRVDFEYNYYYADGLQRGNFPIEIIFEEELIAEVNITLDDGKGFGDYNLTSSALRIYDADTYNETGDYKYINSFYAGSLGYIGIEHKFTFAETFEYYEPFVIRYELIGSDGVTETFYDTVFGVPDSNGGTNYSHYGNSNKGSYEAGNYVLKAYNNDKLLDEITFTVKDGSILGTNTQVVSTVFYDLDGNKVNAYEFDTLTVMGVNLRYGQTSENAVLDLAYAVRTQSETSAEAYENKAVHTTVSVTADMSGKTEETNVGVVVLPFELYNDYPVNEALYADIYVDGNLKKTVLLQSATTYAPSISVEEVMIKVISSSSDELGESSELLIDTLLDITENHTTELSLADIQTGNIGYLMVVGEVTASAVLDSTVIELIDPLTNQVVATNTEENSLLEVAPRSSYVDALIYTEGYEFAAGTYTLRVTYGDQKTEVFTTEITVTE